MEQKSKNLTENVTEYFDKRGKLLNEIQKLKKKIAVLDAEYKEFFTAQNK